MLTRLHRLVLVLSALALLLGACSTPSSGREASKRVSAAVTPGVLTAASVATPAAAQKITHIFVVNLENEDYRASWGPSSPAKYLNTTLRLQGALLTQYFGIGHVSLDNYIAQISGQAPNQDTNTDCVNYIEFASTGTGAYGQALGHGCVFPTTVKTIGDQLHAKGLTWKAYEEDIANSPTQPKTCRHPTIGSFDSTIVASKTDMYATRHDPWVYFHGIIDSPACKTEVVGLNVLTTDLAKATTTPSLAYITPNVCDDGHDAPCKDGRPGGLVSADAFLKLWAPRILASPAYKAGGMLIITFDEAGLGKSGDSSACCHTPPSPNSAKPGLTGPGGGRVGALIISSATKPNTTSGTPYNHYALLCSMENVFGLSHLGFAGAPGLTCFGKDVFNGP
ncbi:MAG TPA: alkaline phosphatase family protein [Acidimicrobiia bacterium]|nr:alkaline phosphatase family protein [Acidimicrobiia bacterium]